MIGLAGKGEAALSIGGLGEFTGGEGVLPSGAAGLSADLVFVAEVEEVHGLADV